MTVTYLLRHAPTEYSAAYRLNGEANVGVPLTDDGVEACAATREAIPFAHVVTCVVSPFQRCRQTAELLVDRTTAIVTEPRLAELHYGMFEGRSFVDYGRWLSRHGPHSRPPSARESQLAGIRRMVEGLRAVLNCPGPRIVVAHGLLLSVIDWTRRNPRRTLYDIFLPATPCLVPLELSDQELWMLTNELLDNLAERASNPGWCVNLRIFPRNVRDLIATVSG